MKFKQLQIQGWKQFKKIDLDLEHRLTILTGTNGCGKTTILALLAKHCGWNLPSIAIPEKNKATGAWFWLTGFFAKKDSTILNKDNLIEIGKIHYSNQQSAYLSIPQSPQAQQYDIQINNQQEVKCFFIPSHRSVFRYEQVNSISTSQMTNKDQAFSLVSICNRNRYFGGNDRPSNFHIKQTLISWNIFGHGNPDMEPIPMLLENFRAFEDILKIVLPSELGFQKLEIRNTEIVLKCNSGEFLLDAVSGGIGTIIETAWQVHMYGAKEDEEITVIIDEIENHLHPTMQRRILPNLLEAFPKINFIVSTHSPLIVNSVQDSTVYVLRYNEDSKVYSQVLDFSNQAKTAAEILDEVLGVSFTMPIWAENKLNQIVNAYLSQGINKSTLSSMREELKKIGLERLMPTAMINLIEEKNA